MTSQPSVAASPRPRPGVTGSLVAQKAVMAVTGVVLFLFVVGHLAGNLKIFEGPAAFNAYAEGLRTVGAPFVGRGCSPTSGPPSRRRAPAGGRAR